MELYRLEIAEFPNWNKIACLSKARQGKARQGKARQGKGMPEHLGMDGRTIKFKWKEKYPTIILEQNGDKN